MSLPIVVHRCNEQERLAYGSGIRNYDPAGKRQASSLTVTEGYCRMNLERNKYGHNTIEKNSRRSGRDPEVSKAGYGKV